MNTLSCICAHPRAHCHTRCCCRASLKGGPARCRAESAAQQVVVVGQVLASEINIGFEDIVNTQARTLTPPLSNPWKAFCSFADVIAAQACSRACSRISVMPQRW